MPLRRESVVDAALALLDEVGLDALTTRALTGRLGVRPGALYWHVKDKRELLTAVAARIMDEVWAAPDPVGVAPDDWAGRSAAFAHALRNALLRHRDGARLVATHTPLEPAAQEAAEEGLAMLRAAGVPQQLAAAFGDTLASYVTGFTLQEQASGAPAAAGDAAFRTGIALITDGLRVALDTRSDQV